ncbi:MAG: serine/threonine protein kinase [Deltaproteobacteria bacterium]|nr:MAG: serine/threonine protein kinase [Deltaproteobacteria bacterium]
MLSAPSKSPGPEELAFLQQRVARFGLFSAALSAFFWVYRLGRVLVTDDPVHAVGDPSLGLHALAWIFLLGIWAANRSGTRSYRFINAVEGIGLEGACISYIVMGTYIPLIARPEMVMLSAITAVLVGRAAYVPGTARRTFVLSVAVGVPFVWTTYLAYSDIDPDLLASVGAAITPEQMALGATLNAAAWWTLNSALATGITQIIYGLRREVRDVKKLGQYVLEEKLGEGGMGVVYKAHHGMLRRPTAIKLLKSGVSNQTAVERFAREVRLTARLTHTNTVTIYDYGRTPDGLFYYAMELLDGATLDEVVAVGGPQPPGRAVKVLTEVASALTEAHGIGLIHRDIKPANIILAFKGGVPDVAKVVDFGLVKDIARDEGAGLTHDNTITGTPHYMAPEAITTPDQVDGRSDVYALGAVGYFLLTGTHVFSGDTLIEVCGHHLHTEPEAPSERLGAPIPSDLEALLLDCLAKDPGHRPESAADLVTRLEGLSSAGTWSHEDASSWWQSFGPALDRRRGAPMAVGSAHTIEVGRRPTPEFG